MLNSERQPAVLEMVDVTKLDLQIKRAGELCGDKDTGRLKGGRFSYVFQGI